MVKSYIIVIEEIDDPVVAAEIFREKLSEIPLLQNTFGIISTHTDVVHSGVYDALCKEAPFPLAGLTCSALATNNHIGTMLFSIMLLTGDDFDFVCEHIGRISGKNADEVAKVKANYIALEEQMMKKPRLALLYTPFALNHLPGEYVDVISEVNPALPIFGGVATGISTYEDNDGTVKNGNLTLCNGEASGDEAVVVLLSGEFTPKFFVSSFTEEAVLANDIGVVTKSERNELLEINSVKCTKFLEKFGFGKDGKSNYDDVNAGLMTVTFVLDYGFHCDINCREDCHAAKQLTSRAPFNISDKGITCAGLIREGAQISIAVSTPESIIKTAKEIIRAVNDSDAKAVLMYSCLGRQVGLYAKPMEELETISAELSTQINYNVSYVGGEICPTCVIPKKANNHEHNQTLVACVF